MPARTRRVGRKAKRKRWAAASERVAVRRGEEEGGGAGRDGVELGFDRGVLVGLDYAGGEVAVV